MGLWRGVPLTEATGPWAEQLRTALARERLKTATTWADLTPRLNRPLEVISTMRELVTEHPLAESLVAVLMRALTAAGRAGEALELFTATRARLAHELGADPGHELRAIHEAVPR
jgi:DNA-binding SARP family transcriptional activator